MTFETYDSWWWPYVYIVLGAWLVTDGWRFLGVFLGGRISEDSDLLVLVRAVATALIAAVISNLIVNPGGPLADTPLALRLGAAALGFAAYLSLGKHILVGIIVTELVLITGMLMWPAA